MHAEYMAALSAVRHNIPLEASETIACDVPERCDGAASMAITPYRETGP
jgi:hypothetical protein